MEKASFQLIKDIKDKKSEFVKSITIIFIVALYEKY
jgi:hypothetical protein